MNIIKLEIKRSFTSFLSFTISMLAVSYLFFSLFPSYAKDAKMLEEVLSNFPLEFRAAFGFSDVDLSTISGFLSFLFSYIILIGAVFGMKLGTSLPSEEARIKTVDFLFSKPIRRSQILTNKLIAIGILIVAQNLIIYILTLLPLLLFIKEPDFDVVVYTCMSFSIGLVQLFFVGVGAFCSTLFRRLKAVTPISLGVVFFFFILEMINQSIMDKKLTYFTPFSYFKGADLIANRSYDVVYVMLVIIVLAVTLTASYVIYQKKDLPTV